MSILKRKIPIKAPQPSDRNGINNGNWERVASLMRENLSPENFDIHDDDTLKDIVTDEIGRLTETRVGTEWIKDWCDLENQRKSAGGHSVHARLFHCPFTYRVKKKLRKNLWAEAVVNFETIDKENGVNKENDVTLMDLKEGAFRLMSKEEWENVENVELKPGIQVRFTWWVW